MMTPLITFHIMSAALAQRLSLTNAEVSGSISGKVRIFNKISQGLGGMVEQNLNRQVTSQNISDLNPKSLRRAFDVKAHVGPLLIANRLSDRDVKPDVPLVLFVRCRLMPQYQISTEIGATYTPNSLRGFLFALRHLTFATPILCHAYPHP